MNESTASMGMMILWMVVIFGVMYFLMIRPQKKEQKRLQAMLNSMEVVNISRRTSRTRSTRISPETPSPASSRYSGL